MTVWPNIAHALYLATKPIYILHDRAGILASLLYKAEKPSVCPSVRHAVNSVISAWIYVGLGLCTAVVSGMSTHASISF